MKQVIELGAHFARQLVEVVCDMPTVINRRNLIETHIFGH